MFQCFRFPDLQEVVKPGFFDRLALNVDVETDGSYSTPSTISPGRNKSPYYSPLSKFSAQSELNNFFGFFHLVADGNGHDLEGI